MRDSQSNCKISVRAVAVVSIAAAFYAYAMVIQVLPLALVFPLTQELQLSGTDLGLLTSSFYWSYAPMQLVVGYLVTRVGIRKVLNMAIFVCCAGGALFAVADSAVLLQVARLLMGVSTACAFVSTLGLIMNWLPLKYYALISGAVGTLGALGGAIGSESVTFMLRYGGWRQVVGYLVLAGAVLWLFNFWLVRDNPEEVTIKAKAELNPRLENSNSDLVSSDRMTGCRFSVKQLLGEVWHQSVAAAYSIGVNGWLVVVYSLFIWAPMLAFVVLWSAPFLQLKLHLDEVLVGHMVMYCWLGLACFSPLLGWYSERFCGRTGLMMMCGLVGLIAIVILIWMPISINAAMILMIMLGFASAGQSLSFMWVRDHFSSKDSNILNGVVNFAIVLGGAIMPSLVGALLDRELGTIDSGAAVNFYTLQNYQNALIIAPACYLGAVMLAGLVWQRCRNRMH